MPVVSKWYTILEIRMHREDHEIPCHTRLRVDEIAAAVSSSTNENKTISSFSSDEKTITSFELNFCQIRSTNVVNNMPKAQSFSQ